MIGANCRQIHNQLYKDAYASIHPKINIEHVRIHLREIGFKFCSECEIFTMQEKGKICQCCKGMLQRGEYRVHKRKRLEEEQENLFLTHAAIMDYTSMVEEKTTRKKIKNCIRDCIYNP